ncbi:MAG: hypothetical protein AAF581_18860 [Planctomycetota bacterium]
MNKLAWGVLTIGCVGVALWVLSVPSDVPSQDQSGKENAAQQQEMAPVPEQTEELLAENQRLSREVDALEAQLREVKADRDLLTQLEADKKEQQEPAILFGQYADLAEVVNAEWAVMGRSALSMTDDLATLVRCAVEGREPEDPNLQLNIAKMNQALISYVLEVGSKINSHSPGNGAFTHPITQSNLLEQALRLAGAELSAGQAERVKELGQEYESEWNRLDASYGDQVPRLQRIFDEIELKREFTEGTRALLSDVQKAMVYRDETQDVSGKDLFSPALIIGSTSRALPIESLSELEGELRAHVAADLDVEPTVLEAHGDVFEAWVATLRPQLQPTPREALTSYGMDEALVAGRAQLDAMLVLAQRLDFGPEQCQSMLDQSHFVVPLLLLDSPPESEDQ